ncbi:MAG: DUF4367 domain-containing protein [Oscillospiraceae bacterium]|jgi:hypothetical protein|nr:DUF4367 domain-containing protein [Oscillospiraceae bacterium]
MDKKEEFLRRAANEYVELQGEALRQEADRLNREAVYPTAGLERRVFNAVRPRKRRWLASLAAVAACLALVFLGGRTLFGDGGSAPSPTAQTPDDTGIIALSFQVPTGFTQTGMEQDQGKSIYYFDDRLGDNVVLTLEKPTTLIDASSFTELNINDADAYAASKEGYQIMTFEKDEVLYTLTCRYDVNTLLRFGEVIL